MLQSVFKRDASSDVSRTIKPHILNHTLQTLNSLPKLFIMSTTNNNSSTLGSYVDSAKALASNALSSVTGNPADQRQAENYQESSDAKYENSQEFAKAGPVNVSGSGAATVDDPNRTQGQWDQTIGNAKSAVGGLVGSQDLQAQGQQQTQLGQGQEAEGQYNDYTSGVGNRVKGTLGAAGASVLGNEDSQQAYQNQRDVGKTQQRSVESDISSQVDAQRNANNNNY